ncbi:MAG: DUF177 domain-containing protein [Gammaproteobacteria bacterium]|nr:DUF177 domain-containing protein [Gammaproteobacteria bacterium]
MSAGWPSTIDPIQLADQGARLTGELPLKGMQRLIDMCLDDAGSAMIDLQFDRSQGDGVRTMVGRVHARLRMTCQRCLRPFELAVRTEPRLLLLRPREREDLLENGDALVVEQSIPLSSLVEDELLLVMPMVPMHAPADCPVTRKSAGSQPQPTEDSRPNPFSVLERLKRTDH